MFLIKGILIGIFISLPFGPIGILCLRNIMVEGRRIGFASGLGAAVSDIFYSIFVSFGMNYILETMSKIEDLIKFIIGFALIFIGIKIYVATPKLREKKKVVRARTSFARLFILGLSNFSTIFIFFAIFTTLNLFDDINLKNILLLIIGIFVGSVLWWYVVSHILHKLNKKVDVDYLKIVNRVSGSIIISAGAVNIFLYLAILLKKY